MEAGAPEISGGFQSKIRNAYGFAWGTYLSEGQAFWGGVNNDSIFNVGFNASRSSKVYGNSETITPLSHKVIFVLKY